MALQQIGQKPEARALLDFRRLVKTVALKDIEDWPSVKAFNKALADHILAHPTLLDERPDPKLRHEVELAVRHCPTGALSIQED